MPRVVFGERKRKYTPKTKTGCHTCSRVTVRRIKCDQEKPSCLKCSSTGRKCEGSGYGDDYVRRGCPSTVSTESLARLDLSTSPTKSPSFHTTANEQERRSFHFFIQTTAPQLSGFYGEKFWNRIVLQAAHYEPIIHHSIVALGSLHERFMQSNGMISISEEVMYKDIFALQHYNFAIKSLVKPITKKERPAMDVCLTACLLFACFETMQGNYGSAIAHVQSGIKILEEIEYDEEADSHVHSILRNASEPHVPMFILMEFFMRLDFQITDMIGGGSWTLFKCFSTIRAQRHYQPTSIPTAFTSLAEARDALEFQRFRALYTVSQIPLPHLGSADFTTWSVETIQVFEQWSAALSSWEKTHEHSLTSLEFRGLCVLRILKNVCYIALSVMGKEVIDEMLWDIFERQFDDIVSLAEKVLLPQPTSSSTSIVGTPLSNILPQTNTQTQATFSLDMEILGPVYGVVSRCRDPRIRRRAIDVMKSSERQEGMWNAGFTARIAERVVRIEEEGLGAVKCAADVPDWARISNVMPTFDKEGRKAIIRYGRVMDHDRMDGKLVRRTVEEVVEW